MRNTSKHPLAEERRRHLKEAAALPFAKRCSYYLNYFKGWLIGVPLTVLAVFLIIKAMFFGPGTALHGYFVNAPNTMQIEENVFLENYITYAQIDESREKVYFNSTFSLQNAEQVSLSKLLSNLTLGEIDFFVCSESAFHELALEGLLSDLEIWMTTEERSACQNRLVRFTSSDESKTNEVSLLDGHLCALDVSDSKRLRDCGAFEGEESIYFCVAINSSRKERTLAFFNWLLTD